ncbi:MAG: segregation/condensation protein A [Clostridia bacterium]|nr:segregation/condensation protein A [Clostridia bacterium]
MTDTNEKVEEMVESQEEAQVLDESELGGFLSTTPEVVYHLEDFDGPLDLLVTLIKTAKIEIEDIFISDITSQYVEIIKNTPKEELDFDYAGDFITMAAELVYLKSIRTLPKDEEDGLEDDEPNEQEIFKNKVREFMLLQKQGEKLKTMETVNRFYREPVYSDKDYRVALVNFSLSKLVAAYAQVLANAERRGQEIIPKKVMKDRFSVHDQMEHIRQIIAIEKEMNFTDLFEPDYDRGDIVTTFLAVLELLKYGKLHAKQDEIFGTITIFAVDGTEDTPIEFEENDDGKY